VGKFLSRLCHKRQHQSTLARAKNAHHLLYIHTVSNALSNEMPTRTKHEQNAPSAVSAPARPTVRQSARRLLDVLDRLDASDDNAAIELAEARHELAVVLASTPSQAKMLTGVDLDPDAFERVFRSTTVIRAGTNFGWRGIAEAVWAAAVAECRGVDKEPSADDRQP
jgi:hypothetical protein